MIDLENIIALLYLSLIKYEKFYFQMGLILATEKRRGRGPSHT